MKIYIENMIAGLTKELNYIVLNTPLDNEKDIMEYAVLCGKRMAYNDLLEKL